jgi:hypothetical protein
MCINNKVGAIISRKKLSCPFITLALKFLVAV